MTRALAALAAAFAALIGWELLPGSADVDTPPPPPPIAAAASRPVQDPALLERSMDEALARPVFAPTRKPPAVEDAKGDAPVAGQSAALPRLSGIVMSPAGSSAILVPANAGAEDKPLVVPVGGRVAAWKIKAIGGGQVTLTGPEGERVLRPAFSNAPPPPPAPVATGFGTTPAGPGAIAIPGVPPGANPFFNPQNQQGFGGRRPPQQRTGDN